MQYNFWFSSAEFQVMLRARRRDAILNNADLEWRMTYVGSADSQDYDQVLDSVLVGPVGPGQYKFVLQVQHSWSCSAISAVHCSHMLTSLHACLQHNLHHAHIMIGQLSDCNLQQRCSCAQQQTQKSRRCMKTLMLADRCT